MRTTRGLAVITARSTPQLHTFQRRDLRPRDVAVGITYCGVCASDLAVVNSVEQARLPLVAGHEFTGVVCAVGSEVTRFSVGDPVAVGNIVDSCGQCENCLAGYENFCVEFPTGTYLGTDRHDGTATQGGWSSEYVLDEKFAYHLPRTLDPAAAAPLMCAGITVWDALTHWEAGSSTRVGIVGLGGLGHLGVRFAKALGAEVTVFTTTPAKADDARALGADRVVVSSDDDDDMRTRARYLDLILDTAAAAHDLSPYLKTLRLHGTLCLLGIADRIDVESFALRWGRHNLSGSGTGSPATTRAMLEFSAERGIVADVEVLPARDVQTALDRLSRNDVRYRFVLDMSAMSDPDDRPQSS